ncbi:Phophatidylinositol-4-phosphate 5-kinase [hydrothermal vent metagenome]|uniref:Phophatidylinositol-4-phosphate 5-kinase n=1 Tax=hydrothermal vent metagenome TaxID=652676 RepID=A0A1W1ELA9_9ZZZZ
MVENLINSNSQLAQNSHSLYHIPLSNAIKISSFGLIFFMFNSFSIDTITDKKLFVNGKVESKISLNEDGIKDGIERRYNKNGTIKYIAYYKNGKKNGIEEWFDREGKILSQTHYKDDIVDGVEKIYYDNGVVMLERRYSNGKKHGLEIKFNRNAMMCSILIYNNGILQEI